MSLVSKHSLKLITSATFARVTFYSLRLLGFQLVMQILGVNNYAIFMVLISLEGWFVNFDFGLGYAYQNQISKANVQEVNLSPWTNGVFRLALYHALIFGGICTVLIAWYSKSLFAHWELEGKEVGYGVYVLAWYLIYTLGNVGYRILFARHKAHLVYLIQMAGGILSFASLFVLAQVPLEGDRLLLALSAWLIPPAIMGLFVFIKYFMKRIHFHKLPRNTYQEIGKISSRFFVTSLLSIGVVYVDYFIMARTLSAHDIASYSIIQKYFSAIFFVFFAMLSATWPKCSELMHSGKVSDAVKKTQKLIFQGLLWICFGACAFYLLQPFIILFFGSKIYPLSLFIIFAFALYFFIRIITDSFQMLLQAVNDLSWIVFTLPLQAFLSIYLQWKLSTVFGLVGILFGLSLAYSFTVLWILPLRFYLIWRKDLL